MFSRFASLSNYADSNYDIINVVYCRLSSTCKQYLKEDIDDDEIGPSYIKFTTKFRRLAQDVLEDFTMIRMAAIFFESYYFPEHMLNNIKEMEPEMYRNIRKLQMLCIYYDLLDYNGTNFKYSDLYKQGKFIKIGKYNSKQIAYRSIDMHFDVNAIVTDNIYRDIFFATSSNIHDVDYIIKILDATGINFSDICHCFSQITIQKIIEKIKINFLLESESTAKTNIQGKIPVTISSEITRDLLTTKTCLNQLVKSEDNDIFIVELINKFVENRLANGFTIPKVSKTLFTKISNVQKSLDQLTDIAKVGIMIHNYKRLGSNIIPDYLIKSTIYYLMSKKVRNGILPFNIIYAIVASPFATPNISRRLIRKYIKFNIRKVRSDPGLGHKIMYYLLTSCNKEINASTILHPIISRKWNSHYKTNQYTEVILAHLPLNKELLYVLKKMNFNISEPMRFVDLI